MDIKLYFHIFSILLGIFLLISLIFTPKFEDKKDFFTHIFYSLAILIILAEIITNLLEVYLL